MPVAADLNFADAAKLLPDRVGTMAAQGAPRAPAHSDFEQVKPRGDALAAASRFYAAPTGERLVADLIAAPSDAEAYALLTIERARQEANAEQFNSLDNVGTVAFARPGRILFYKGPALVMVYGQETQAASDTLNSFARQFAETLAAGTGEVPTLVKHLPGDEAAQARAVYAVSLSGLKEVVRDQPVLDAVSFDGGTEAATARYDQGRLVIFEFQTPQLASDADARVTARIAELRGQNQPVPAAYRREGNYAVFVFDAPNEQAAEQLAAQVKYEKVVQWLGDDPHRFERANRFWLNMSGSIILNTIKATGLAIILCLGVGGLFGGVIFMRRRAQAALSERYSDAGGMMRLNLDELAGATNGRPQLLPRREE
jgi:hypothetical protein